MVRLVRQRRIEDYFSSVRIIIGHFLFLLFVFILLFNQTLSPEEGYHFFGPKSLYYILKVWSLVIPIQCASYLFSFRRSERLEYLRESGYEKIFAPMSISVFLVFYLLCAIEIMTLLWPDVGFSLNELFYQVYTATNFDVFVVGELVKCVDEVECVKINRYVKPYDFALYFSTSYVVLVYAFEITLFKNYLNSSQNRIMIRDDSIDRLSSYVAMFLSIVVSLIIVGANPIGVGLFSGLVGAGLSITFKDLLHNFAAGIVVSLDESIKKNNYIILKDGISGTITAMNFRYSIIKNRNEVEHIVPNSMLLTEIIENHSKSSYDVRQIVEFKISSEISFRNVISALAVTEKPLPSRLLSGPGREHKVFYKGLETGYHLFELRFWINDPGAGVANIKSEVMVWIYDTLLANKAIEERGIPKFEVRITDEKREPLSSTGD